MTGGNLVFWGDMHGYFRAFDAKNGKELWKMQLGSGIGPGAITYEVNGKQYIAIVVGRSVSLPAFLAISARNWLPRPPRLVSFSSLRLNKS